MALAAMVAAAAVDIALRYGIGFGVSFLVIPIPYPMAFGTVMVFLLEAVALAAVGSPAVPRRDGWRHALPLLVLAVAVQTWVFAFDAMQFGDIESGSSGSADLVIGFALAAIAVLLPLALGLGWRAGLLLAATCYPFALSLANRYVWTADGGRLPWVGLVRSTLTTMPQQPTLLALLFLPPMLALWWGAAKTLRAARVRDQGEPT